MSLLGKFFGTPDLVLINFGPRKLPPKVFGWLIAELCVDQSGEVIQGALLKIRSPDDSRIIHRISSNTLVTQYYVLPFVMATYSAAFFVMIEEVNERMVGEYLDGVESYLRSSPLGKDACEVVLGLHAKFSPKLTDELLGMKEQKIKLSELTSACEISRMLIDGLNGLTSYQKDQLRPTSKDIELMANSFRSSVAYTLKSCVDNDLRVVA